MPSGCIIDSAAYKRIATIIAIIMAVFQIIVAGYGFIVTNMRCAIHLTFAITLVGMYKPVRFKSNILTDTYNIASTRSILPTIKFPKIWAISLRPAPQEIRTPLRAGKWS